MRLSSRFLAVLLFFVSVFSLNAQQKSALDAVKIAGDYYNSIVKILLIDSVAEKTTPGKGYLGRGSGFFVTEDGYIFTNRHVVDYGVGYMHYNYFDPSDKKMHDERDTYVSSALKDPDYLSIDYVRKANIIVQVYFDRLGKYKLFSAKIVAIDSANFDGAILKIVSEADGKPITDTFHPVPIGNSDATSQGEDLCVYGFPSQYDAGYDIMLKDLSTLTIGKHSGFDFVYSPEYGFIKTEAAIHGGNSGGPVFNQSNKVIGLASKTIDKTNIGLVGGINAMYNLAALQPDLLQQLVAKGLTPPEKKLPVNTAVLESHFSLPTKKRIKQSNIFKNTVRSFKGSSWYFKGSVPISYGDKYFINPGADDSKYKTNSGSALKFDVKSQWGAEIGRFFTLWRISPVHKLSLDWTMVSLATCKMDWSKSNLYEDKEQSILSYKTNAEYYRFSTRLGLNYSHIFLNQFVVDAYYKASLFYDYKTIIGHVSLPSDTTFDISHQVVSITPSAQNPDELKFYSYGVFHSVGFNIRYKVLFVGMEYSFGKSKIDYAITYSDSHQKASPATHGVVNMNTINLTFGIILTNQRKWKSFLIKDYKKSLK